MLYQLKTDGVIRTTDGAHIPATTRNRDWRDYQDWLALGNTPDPAAPDPAPIDYSDTNNLDKTLKALALCVAQVGGLTVPQIRTLFKQKWESLP
jgi:hypothetical protein